MKMLSTKGEAVALIEKKGWGNKPIGSKGGKRGHFTSRQKQHAHHCRSIGKKLTYRGLIG